MRKLFKKFTDSDSGNFLPIFGVLVFPLLTMTLGAAVDYSRMNNLQSRMQSASDIALLAATKAIQSKKGNKTSAEINAILVDEFTPFFQANMRNQPDQTFTYSPVFNNDTNKSTVKVGAQYKPVFMQLFGYDEIDIEVELTVSLKVELNNYVIDIVMCIDATGSMQNTLNAAVSNAKSFNVDLRKELGMENNPALKVRVRPMFYRDWEDAIHQQGLSPLDGGTDHVARYRSHDDVFKYVNDFIDLDPNDPTKKDANSTQFRSFLDSEDAIGGYDLPEAAATCINQAVRSNWYDPESASSKEYFNVASGAPINQPHAPNNVNITVIPVTVFWSDADISDPAKTNKYIDSTQPNNWTDMESQIWHDASKIDQDGKILIRFGPENFPDQGGGYDRAYDYCIENSSFWDRWRCGGWARDYQDHPFFNPPQGWSVVEQWGDYTYGGSLNDGNANGAKIIGKKIKEKIPDLLRLSS